MAFNKEYSENIIYFKFVIVISFMLFFIFLANAYVYGQDLSLDIQVGYTDNYVPGDWLPISIIIANEGEVVSGELIITTTNEDVINNEIRETEYIIPVSQAARSRKIYRKTIYYKMNYFSRANIRLESNGRILYENDINLKKIYQQQKILVVNDSFSGFGFLTDTEEEGRLVLYQEVEYLPADWLGYQGIDLLILDKADYTLLTNNQKRAILDWLELGNTVIISGEGSYQTYNTDLMYQLFPANYIGKESIEIRDVPAAIWQLRADEYRVVKKTGDMALALGRQHGDGQVIFSLVDFQNPEVKELYYKELLGLAEADAFFQTGFLDFLVEDMFNSVKFNFLEKYQVFILLVSLILIISYLSYLFTFRKSFKFHIFFLLFILVIGSFSGILYKAIYQPVVEKNDILSEIALVYQGTGMKQAMVESYFTFQGLKRDEIEFAIDRTQGSLTSYSTEAVDLSEGAYQVYLKEDVIEVGTETDGKKLLTGFRSYYKADLPLYFNLVELENGYDMQVINNSHFDIDALFIKYQDNWYTYSGLPAAAKTSYTIPSTGNQTDRTWFYRYVDRSHRSALPDNVNRKIMNRILREIDVEIENTDVDEDTIYIVGVLLGEGFNIITTRDSVNKKFLGILKTNISTQ
ncbi:MAG: hypothetical protein ACLFPF_02850 [Halanaerobiales bacterium]